MESSESNTDEEIIQIGEHGMLIIAEMFHSVSLLKEATETTKPEVIAKAISGAITKYNELNSTGMVEDLLEFRRQFYARRLS